MTIHGHAADGFRSREYISWFQMRQRCNNPNHERYADYGGRGIKVCKRWNDFRKFYIDMGDRPVGMTLDRKNVNGNYNKKNCQWSSLSVQNKNQRRWFINGRSTGTRGRDVLSESGRQSSRDSGVEPTVTSTTL